MCEIEIVREWDISGAFNDRRKLERKFKSLYSTIRLRAMRRYGFGGGSKEAVTLIW